jgi:hypothetical protein
MTRRELETYLINNQGRPTQPVGVGEQWEPDLKQIRQMYQLTDQDQVSGSTKLASISTVNGRRAAELTTVSSTSKHQGEMAMTEQMKGSLWLDLETGQLLKSTSEGTTTAKDPQTMPAPNGAQMRIDVDNSGKSTMRLTTTPGNPGSGGAGTIAGAPPTTTSDNPLDTDSPSTAPVAKAASDPWAGTFQNPQLTLELKANTPGDYEGTILFKDQKFPVSATGDARQLKGTFRNDSGAFDFTLSADGGAITFKTGTKAYQLKKQAVNPLGGAPSPVNPLAMEPVELTGAAPKAAASAANPGSTRASSAAAPSYFRMKLARVMDAHGFERPLTAITLLIPTNWTVQGGVEWGTKGPGGVVTFRASSPDGRTVVEAFPPASWEWSSDPSMVQIMQRQRANDAKFGLQGSEIGPPLSARDYLTRYLVPRSRAGARFLGADVVPESAQAVANDIRKAQQEAIQGSFRTQLQGDSARIHIAYEREGQAEEEWLTGVAYARGTSYPAVSQSISYSCGALNLFAFSAPAGRLEANEKLFKAIVGSMRPDPNWQARVQQVQANIQAIQLKGAVDRSRIIAKSAEDTSQIINETYQRRQESQDRISQKWSQVNRGVETYRDPSNGETVELSNAYGNAWKNGRGEYLLSDSPGFDPAVELKENWTRLEHVEPGKPPE